MKALTQDELLKVLKAASSSKRNHAMILLAFRHGMRVSEVCQLKMTDVDLANRQITIRRLKGSLTSTQPLVDIPGQPLLSELRMLKAWLVERSTWQDRDGWVFPSQKGGCLTRFGARQMFQAVCEEAGIPKAKAHFHTLKHALGFVLAEQNTAIQVIQRTLGHKNVSSSAVYCQPTDETASRIANDAILQAFKS